MISETLPLNEWPSEDLETLRYIIHNSQIKDIDVVNFCTFLVPVIDQAIEDAKERENELPY